MNKLTNVVTSEYYTVYITDDGKAFNLTGYDPSYTMSDIGLSDIVKGAGDRYNAVLLDSKGNAYIVGHRQPNNKFINTIPMTGVVDAASTLEARFLLKDGLIYAYGEDRLKVNGGAQIVSPMLILHPSGKTFKKIIASSDPNGVLFQLFALATDGSFWVWKNKNTPEQLQFPGNKARDFAIMGSNAIVVETDSDLFGWGPKANYIGREDYPYSNPVSIKSRYTALGAVFPTKQLIGNYNTLHLIDQNDNMFGEGDNAMGEVGNGEGYNWSIEKKYAWNWGMMKYQKPVQIAGKWKNIQTAQALVFYLYAQNLDGQWFSWGRNKAGVLGNGLILDDASGNTYPNAIDMLSPSYVDVLNQTTWSMVRFNPNSPIVQVPVQAPALPSTPPDTPPTPAGKKPTIYIYDDGTWEKIN